MPKPIHLIAAIDKNRGLGKDNDLAWYIPEDMKYFKNITTTTEDPTKTNAVLMGRKTWESIPLKFRPLPNRYNIILSRSIKEPPSNAEVFSEIHSAIQSIQERDDIESIFIIGGASIYNQSLRKISIDKIYLTQLFSSFECDTFLDSLPKQYQLNSESELKSHDNIEFKFQVFSKN